MQTRDFSFKLPEELIAQHPPAERGTSRLLTLKRETGEVRHLSMSDFPRLVKPGSVIVFNDTRVRKARLFGTTDNGGRVEFLLLNRRSPAVWEAVIGRRKRQTIGRRYSFPGGVSGTLVEKPDGLAVIEFDTSIDERYLEEYGSIPLPPYIRRQAGDDDDRRYQTVYSRESGSVAAPTAGLHFTPKIVTSLESRVTVCYVTLHVGIGTFAPIRTDSLEEHKMHREEYEIPQKTAQILNSARDESREIIAVGTTTVRTLESAALSGRIKPGRASTDLFIRPGYRFQVVDNLFTNFHTPESSLLVMVSAFAGREQILDVYAQAVAERYRFFSYGDAMFIQ